MPTRRDFLGSLVGGVAAAATFRGTAASAAGRLAWLGPIGLEIYTVRKLFAEDPAKTLKEVAAAGYKLIEVAPGLKPPTLNADLRAAGLAAPSGYFGVPETLADWEKSLAVAHGYGLKYIVVGDNPVLDADQWKRRAEFFNKCGKASLARGIQFCYHAHFHEFTRLGNTCGYDILLTRCPEKLLKMEMDIFWVTYAGEDPIKYWRRYPGRFPLLHIKDMRKGVSRTWQIEAGGKRVLASPSPAGPNIFAAVGEGTIDWHRIFSHVHLAGARYIYVEQDRCNRSPLESIRDSYHYLRNLRLS